MPHSTYSRRATFAVWAVVFVSGLLALPTSASSAGDEPPRWGDPCRDADSARMTAVQAFYEHQNGAGVWLTADGWTRAGRQLVRLLADAGRPVLTKCLERRLAHDSGDQAAAALEVMLSDAYLALNARRTEAAGDFQAQLAKLTPGGQEAIRGRTDANGTGDARVNRARLALIRRIAAMTVALERYRRIAEQGGWPTIEAGAAIEPGDTDSRLGALRQRLEATDDLREEAAERESDVYRGPLVRAVEAFQARHGVQSDGVVDADTRAALNVRARERGRRLAVNLRRMRGRAKAFDGPTVRVNIPAFRATLREAGRVTYRTRAIVGQPDNPTPTLDTRIEAVTLNPTWYVPQKIVREDLAPLFARDPGYAQRNGFRTMGTERSISEIEWEDNPAVAIRQAPGPDNELGRLKFEMPNPRRIYLHDTPKQHLFESRRRAFSAGCVRIEEPMDLAARLTGIAEQRIEEMAEQGDTQTLRFGWRVPVQLVYFTAWVDNRGRVQFRPDIYGRDDRGQQRTLVQR